MTPETIEKTVKIIESCQTTEQLERAQSMAHNYSKIVWNGIKSNRGEYWLHRPFKETQQYFLWKNYNDRVEEAIIKKLNQFAPWLKISEEMYKSGNSLEAIKADLKRLSLLLGLQR